MRGEMAMMRDGVTGGVVTDVMVKLGDCAQYESFPSDFCCVALTIRCTSCCYTTRHRRQIAPDADTDLRSGCQR